MKKWHPRNLNAVLATILVGVLSPSLGWALTAADTMIKNQASATFKDETGTVYSVTSNMVETLVQQVAGLELNQSQSKLASAGGTVEFPHTVTNTGNGDDSYNLSGSNLGSDDYDFSNVIFYADANQDGQADDLASPITQTPVLKAGESFSFVSIASVPASVSSGNTGQYSLTGGSVHTPAATVSNTDTANITDQAIVDVTKALSAAAGKAGSGNYTVTLRYHNRSQVSAANVAILDALPAGMEYVPGSARWSESGVTILTDVDPTDMQGSVQTIRYCAYDSSCSGIAEAQQDVDSDTTNQVTAVISEVAPDSRGEVRFEVRIANGQLPAVLVNTAEYEYYDGAATTDRFPTNSVRFDVTQVAGVITNGSNASNVNGTNEPIEAGGILQNGAAVFHDFVWNTGNGPDSFDLTLTGSSFPAGTVFQLYHTDGYTPMLDNNGNSIPDTGTRAAGSVYEVVLKAILPPGASGGDYSVTLVATSFRNAGKSDPAINHLTSITANGVDLTNNAALGNAGVAGAGAGPEANAVTTNIVMPGATTRFTLYVNNTSASADNFDLSASTDSSFATIAVPAGWKVTFMDDAGNAIANTGIMAANSAKLVYADVRAPADAGVGLASLYFRVISPVTGATDIKHDAITVGEVGDVVLSPDNQGQLLPGGVIVYSHWLVNQGNIDQDNVTFSFNDGSDGWQSLLYADTDGNGVLSGGDARLSAIANLAVGESRLIFAKVHAAATLPMGAINVTTITASWNGGADSNSATDTTMTNRSDISIRKEQAPDANCNGSPDAAFSYSHFAAGPGECIIYRLTAVNTGAETMHNVRIQDKTPAYTSFITAGGLPSLSQGGLAAPISNGSRGEIIGAMGSLDPGYSATLTFGIEIE
ncbi:MAG: DUF11 domain-containing protein [Gammaproteobacteria bacterium]|nr:DUF11 domain-containing protein [Gammaproteobacteria bacterium]MBU1725497.1 DUF11 domain-containing protein [Gammaproteobacteria bacterium]MBU2007355.1 DUF11 domain-containing protein [Gammaproteobacteria bacterium]